MKETRFKIKKTYFLGRPEFFLEFKNAYLTENSFIQLHWNEFQSLNIIFYVLKFSYIG